MSVTNENDKDDNISPLEARVAFAGMNAEAGNWARAVWRLNPQFLDYYALNRLASIEDALYSYDIWDSVKEDYRTGKRTAVFYDKDSGRDIRKIVIANSHDELKLILLAEARSFVPNPNDYSPVMNHFFKYYGSRWISLGLPTCWQEFNGICVNPDYADSLSWDEGADGDKELISSFKDAPTDDDWD